MDRADLAEGLIIVTSSAACGVGLVALAQGFVTVQVEAWTVAVVAGIVVVVGRAMLLHNLRAARDQLGATRTGAVVQYARRRRVASLWQSRIERAGSARAWWAPVALVAPLAIAMPFGAAADSSLLWRWPLLQLVAATSVAVSLVAYAETVGASRGPAALVRWPLFVVLALLVTSSAFLVAGRTFDSQGWGGVLYGSGVAVSSYLVAMVALVPQFPGGGGLVVWLARHVSKYRREAAVPADVQPFYLVVGSSPELEGLVDQKNQT